MVTTAVRDTFIVCRNSQGVEVRATLLRLTRYLAVFEVYNPYSILQLSEVLDEFKIIMNDRLVYSGRAVVSNLVNTGIFLVCEAALEENWLDVDLLSPLQQKERLHKEFREFVQEWEKVQRVSPDFKVLVSDIHTFLMDLRHWLEQVELGIRSNPTEHRARIETDIAEDLQKIVLPEVLPLFDKLESTARGIGEDLQSLHRSYLRRHLHPLVLCAPFVYRVFQKPLGYAGDYMMVNMILNDPHQGGSLFAKMLNRYFLSIAPCVAHRNRIRYLMDTIASEIKRCLSEGRIARVFNLGCGPAQEIQNFLAQDDLCEKADFTLVDFNDETLEYTGKILNDLKQSLWRTTSIHLVKQSVNQILKDSLKAADTAAPQYDLVYCAGLFDYLSERVCKRLVEIFYGMVAPNGLLVLTNVDASNPNRYAMEYLGEWHLVYRNRDQMLELCPQGVSPANAVVKADPSGVNLFLEIRKPGHD